MDAHATIDAQQMAVTADDDTRLAGNQHIGIQHNLHWRLRTARTASAMMVEADPVPARTSEILTCNPFNRIISDMNGKP